MRGGGHNVSSTERQEEVERAAKEEKRAAKEEKQAAKEEERTAKEAKRAAKEEKQSVAVTTAIIAAVPLSTGLREALHAAMRAVAETKRSAKKDAYAKLSQLKAKLPFELLLEANTSGPPQLIARVGAEQLPVTHFLLRRINYQGIRHQDRTQREHGRALFPRRRLSEAQEASRPGARGQVEEAAAAGQGEASGGGLAAATRAAWAAAERAGRCGHGRRGRQEGVGEHTCSDDDLLPEDLGEVF